MQPLFPTSMVDRVIDRALADRRIVGTVVLIAHDGRIVFQRAAGLADREARRPMRVDTLFRLASLSKPVVSAVAMALVAQRNLSLGDPVTRWLPDFRPALPASATSPGITIRQLLTHTAGLGYGFLEAAEGPYRRAKVSDGMDQPGLSLRENLRRIADVPLLYAPGTAWRYSVATDVLGAVVEKVTGQSLPRVVAEQITAPLAMQDTGFSVTQPDRLAAAYVDAPSEPARMSDPQFLGIGAGIGITFSPARALDPASFPSAGAGMVGSAPDLLRFFETVRQGGGPILAQDSASAMMRNQIDGLTVDLQGPGWGFGYGGAVLVDPALARSPHSAGTWQWGGVYGHTWFVDPARKLTVVALTNTAVEGMSGQYPSDLRAAIYRALDGA